MDMNIMLGSANLAYGLHLPPWTFIYLTIYSGHRTLSVVLITHFIVTLTELFSMKLSIPEAPQVIITIIVVVVVVVVVVVIIIIITTTTIIIIYIIIIIRV